MKKLILIIYIAVLSVGFLAAQTGTSVFVINVGNHLFQVNSNAAQFEWYINDIIVPGETNGFFQQNWDTGSYKLSAIPIQNSCKGNMKSITVVATDPTIYGGNVTFTGPDTLQTCFPDIKLPGTMTIELPVLFKGYTLGNNESYTISYTVDSDNDTRTLSLSDSLASFPVILDGLGSGYHTLKIIRLNYDTDNPVIIDYSGSPKIPTVMIYINEKYKIGTIQY